MRHEGREPVDELPLHLGWLHDRHGRGLLRLRLRRQRGGRGVRGHAAGRGLRRKATALRKAGRRDGGATSEGAALLLRSCLDRGEREGGLRLRHRLAPADAQDVAHDLFFVHGILGPGCVLAVDKRYEAAVARPEAFLL